MTTSAAKDFGAIEGDYDFFMATSDESERDLQAYRPYVDAIATTSGQIRMLDFGCGGGDFSAAFLNQAEWLPERLTLSLVEPVESQRHQTAKRLQCYTQSPIQHWSLMPEKPIGPFELVLANHVFYYVTELKETVRRLLSSMAPSGMFLIAMAGKTNGLFPFWQLGFDMAGQEIPYHVSEDLEAAFETLGQGYERQDVAYDMVFPDTTANRMKILRFLFAKRLADMQVESLLELFEPWVRDGQVVMNTTCQHYIVRAD